MRTSTRLTLVAMFTVLTSLALFTKGCGKSLNGGQCGGCPDSTAPLGSTVVAPTLDSATIAPASGVCYAGTSFQFLDKDLNPLNDICVEITTNGAIALHTADTPAGCASVATNPQSYIRTKTNNSGIVMVDFVAACGAGNSGSTSLSAFVTAQSCGIEGTAKATVTVSAPGCP